jgi:hypothetical protein
MTQCTVEPLRHLHFPIRHARKLMPATRPMHPSGDTDDLARCSYLAKCRVEVRRFAEGNVLVFVAENL